MMGRIAKIPNAGLLQLLWLLLLFGAVSPKHHGNPANELVEIINANRTSNKLSILNNNPGLGCMALQYIMECGGNCSRNNTSICTPPEVDFTEIFAPNCGVELPTVNIISGRLVGCNQNDLDPLEAYASVLVPDNKTLSILYQKNHTEVGVGLGRTGHKKPFFWCVLFSSGPSNSTFVLDTKEMVKQKQGCFSGIDSTCNSSAKISSVWLNYMSLLVFIYFCSLIPVF
ncbi:unnamed protein product [Victoria cruziana]